MWIQRFRTLMEPATRTAGEELSGLSGHIQTVLRTLVSDLIDFGHRLGPRNDACGIHFSLQKTLGKLPEAKKSPVRPAQLLGDRREGELLKSLQFC